jgi:leucyl-tRNA---protein transferase
MHLHVSEQISDEEPCSNLPDRKARQEYFLATGVDENEIEGLLETGWRHFGPYFYRPSCKECQGCIPLRIRAREFTMSKSQRRTIRKNRDIRVEITGLHLTDQAFCIYQKHSMARFNKEVARDEFEEAFFIEATPSLQSNYYVGDTLAAIGFLDKSKNGLSSIYFVFDPVCEKRGLGTLSVLVETSYCAELGLDYYYLGYYIEKNPRMAYKRRFFPHELYDWNLKKWVWAV